jgi:cell surface protein SprA
MEKFPLFAQFATSVSIENSFTSEYNEATSVDINSVSIPSNQNVTQSFNPLIGINITFKEAFGGSLTASVRFNNSVTNALVPQSNLIQTTNTNDWSVIANYAKSGFEIPLFGLSLKNDIAFALTISKNTSNPLDYRFTLSSDGVHNDVEPVPGNGSSVLTFNPSIQYSLSAKVQMQLFYKYIRTEPTQGTANTIPRTSNEGGLNIRISIQ